MREISGPLRRAKVLALALILLAPAALDRAQSIVAHNAAGPARLDGPWLLYEGDPPGGPFASVDPRPGQVYWLSRGRPAPQGPNVVWLRATVTLDAPISNASLLINPNADDCAVFVNGQKAADCARWPRTTIAARRWMLLHLSTGPAQVSLRIVGPLGHTAKLPRSSDVLVGETRVLEDIRTADDATHLYHALLQTLLCLGELLGGVILLLAYRNDRGAREYLWFAAFLFLDGTMSLESVFNVVYPLLPLSTGPLTNALGMIGRYALLVGFIAAFTGVRLNRWLRAYQVLLLVVPVFIGLPYLTEQLPWLPRVSDHAFDLILLLIQMPFIAGSLGFLAWRWRRGNREAGLLLPSFLLASAIEVLGITVPWFRQFHAGRFGFEYDDLSMFFFLISIGPVLLFRHRRVSLEQVRVTAEFEAAREVQQRLVTPPPTVPGFQIECEYLPAAQVGGDFYRILPEDDGGVLVVVGDVSGKGLPAAMTVSAIVGSLRTLSSAAPAEILRALNRSLAGNLRGGFVTSLVARLGPDGCCSLASAGHLAPYLNGEELAIENGFPLGLDPIAIYRESQVQVPPGVQLTLLTDGVVEARSASGELFGFKRTAAISGQPADQIAHAAKQFGQEDDITVLTLTLVPGTRAHA